MCEKNIRIYKVGGCVRDRLLGTPSADIDWVVVGADAGQMLAQGYKPVGADFPVFLHPETGEEYALARTERKSGKGYGGFSFHADPDVTLEQDLLRRDLTINAMAEDAEGRIIDPYGGRQDLERRLLRHVSPAFAEDPLRVLRVARFTARLHALGFSVASETLELMRTMVASGELEALTAERLWKEYARALMEPHPEVFIQTLRDCGALAVLMPELDRLFGIPQSPHYHPEVDTGIHVLLTLRQSALHQCPLPVRWACLLHDLGKGLTPQELWPNHPDHEAQGVPLIRAVNQRFKTPKECAQLALMVGEYHLYCHRALELAADELLTLLLALDAVRRPERLAQFVLACTMDARGCLNREQLAFPQADYLLKAAQLIADEPVTPLLEQGLKGSALGEALRTRQLQRLGDYVRAQGCSP